MRSVRRCLFISTGLLACLVFTGCGGKAVPVEGKLVFPPNVKSKLQENDSITISFDPDGSGRHAGGTANPADGTFTIRDSAGAEGVLVGKYKVSIHITGYPDPKAKEDRTKAFADFNKQFTPDATRITYEVTGEPHRLKIDLTNGNITKE